MKTDDVILIVLLVDFLLGTWSGVFSRWLPLSGVAALGLAIVAPLVTAYTYFQFC